MTLPQFVWPWLLLLIPCWGIIFIIPPLRRERIAIYFPFLQQLAPGDTSPAPSMLIIRSILFVLWVLLCIALARPQFVGDPLPDTRLARNLVLAVDISESMSTRDMLVNRTQTDRLTAAKGVLETFIARRSGDQLALVLFGSQAYIQAPLTFDSDTVQALLQETEIGIAGRKTAIGDALLLSIKLIENSEEAQADNSSIILLSDGSNSSGKVQPQTASQLAREKKIRIYAIGLGNSRFRGDIDETTLRAIAQQTGGQYFRAENTGQLSAIYNQLDQLNQTETRQHSYRPVTEIYHYPLAAALLLLIALLAVRMATNMFSFTSSQP